jgi:hypothetical protein
MYNNTYLIKIYFLNIIDFDLKEKSKYTINPLFHEKKKLKYTVN